MSSEMERVIRPAAVINDRAARLVLDMLKELDVAAGGTWSATPSVWQRFDRPWNGPGGLRGTSQMVGSIYVTYNRPVSHYVTMHRVTVTEHGLALGWTVDRLADEALREAGLTLATCPRDTSLGAVHSDPFGPGNLAARNMREAGLIA